MALTVPARIFVGMALDRFGPRRTYSAILIYAVDPVHDVRHRPHRSPMLVVSRLLLGIVGAGFVVGIRMVSEWFPPARPRHRRGRLRRVGQLRCLGRRLRAARPRRLARAAPDGWRWAIGLTGVIAAAYGVVYLPGRAGHPRGRRLRALAPRRPGLEVTNRKAVFGLAALTVPVWAILGVIAWRVWDVKVISTLGAGRRRRA